MPPPSSSRPGLGVNITSVRRGDADLAVGDLVGSSLMNLLILAVLDLTRYSRGRMLSQASANQALGATSSIALTAIVAIFIVASAELGPVEIWRIGPGTIVLLVAYLLCLRLIHRGRSSSAEESDGEHAVWPPFLRKLSLKGAITGYVAAGAVILVAAPFVREPPGISQSKRVRRHVLRLDIRRAGPCRKSRRRSPQCAFALSTWRWATSSAATASTWSC